METKKLCFFLPLKEKCTGIKDEVLKNMTFYKVVEKKNRKSKNILLKLNSVLFDERTQQESLTDIKNETSELYGLYRWWVPEESDVMRILNDFAKKNDFASVLQNLEQRTFLGKTYYVLYFGKSINVWKRIVRQHLNGSIRTSTLRCTLSGLCSETGRRVTSKNDISRLFRNTYFEILIIDEKCKNVIFPLETICIALGYYPLNIEGSLIDENWIAKLMEARKHDQ